MNTTQLRNNLVPYCISQRVDTTDGSVRSYIGYPDLVVDRGGKNPRYECMYNSSIYQGWEPYGSFYGLDPTYRPLPLGMILLCAESRNGFPYDTVKITQASSLFIKDGDIPDCVYFVAYNHHTVNTVPLYFFMLPNQVGGSVVISVFDKKDLPQPGKELGFTYKWEPATPIPMVHVIAPGRISPHCPKPLSIKEITELKFSNVYGECVPKLDGEYIGVGECAVTTDPKNNRDILKIIKYEKEELADKVTLSRIDRDWRNIAVPIISFVCSFLIVGVFLLYITPLKK